MSAEITCENCMGSNTVYLINYRSKGIHRCCLDCFDKSISLPHKKYSEKLNHFMTFDDFQRQKKEYESQRHKEASIRWNQKLMEDEEFFSSDLWRRKRFQVFAIHGNFCLACGRKPPEVTLHVDHVKPRSKYKEIDPLDVNNLQVLCADCNIGKSNDFETDFRTQSLHR